MKKNLIFLIVSVLFVWFPSELFGYPWPVRSFNIPHPITATLGEYRTDHLHAGVDIGEGIGTEVFSVVDGKITGILRTDDNAYVKVRDNSGIIYDYVHIRPVQERYIGEKVFAGITILGIILDPDDPNMKPHLHFEENNGGLNPLRPEGLDNYTDTARPYVSSLEFFQQGTETQLTNNVYGQVDILSQARDAQSLGNPDTCVYRIGYQVEDIAGNLLLGPLYELQFDSIVGGSIDLVYANFGTHQSDKNTYYYWVTNTMSENRYWNTRLRLGQQWNGLDARVNYESTYQDGKYKVSTLAFDIQDNGGDIANQRGAITEEITIDNFRPYVQKVTIGNKYSREWTFDGTNLNSDKASIDEVLKTDKYTITVIFSEPVISATLLIDTFGAITLSSSEPVNNQKTFTGTLSIPSEDSKHDGQRTMTISARDLASNQTLQITGGTTQVDPATQLTRDSSGNMQGTGGKDTLHKFIIDTTPPEITLEAPYDGAVVNIDIIRVIGKVTDNVEVERVSIKVNEIEVYEISGTRKEVIINTKINLEEGLNSICVTAEDTVGNSGSMCHSVTYKKKIGGYDGTGPDDDFDGDGIPNKDDPDDDNDGMKDEIDPCPFNPDPDCGIIGTGGIYGKVIDGWDNTPIKGANIKVTNDITINTSTDEKGKYSIGGLKEGTYTVTASHKDYDKPETQQVFVIIDKEAEANFSLFKKPPPGWIYGHVRNSRTNAGISGAEITCTGENVTLKTVSGEWGSYKIQVEPGTYTLTATKEGYKPGTTTATVIAGKSTEVDIYLEPIGTGGIYGKVTEIDSEWGIEGARVDVNGKWTITSYGEGDVK